MLVREYQGQRHTVTVGREGFDWQGTTYSSLSAIARAITGTAWSGPRFFALKSAADGANPKRRSATDPKPDPERSRKLDLDGTVKPPRPQDRPAEYAPPRLGKRILSLNPEPTS